MKKLLKLRGIWRISSLRNLAEALDQTLCGIMGHEEVQKTTGNRIYTECIKCLKKSSGIEVHNTMQGYSMRELDEIYDYMMDLELGLHRGG